MTATQQHGDNRLPLVLAAINAMVSVEGAEVGARIKAGDMAEAGIVPDDLLGKGSYRADAIVAWKTGVIGKAGMAELARARKAGKKAHEVTVARVKRAGGGTITGRDLTTAASSAMSKLAGYVRDALTGDKPTGTRTSKPSVNVRCHNIANERDKLVKLVTTPTDQLTKADKELLAGIGSAQKAGEIAAALNIALSLFSAPVRTAEGVIVPRVDNVPAPKRQSSRRRPYSEADDATIHAMLAEGTAVRDIAKVLGRTTASVKSRIGSIADAQAKGK